MQMRGCKDWVFGYSVWDVAARPLWTELHVAAERRTPSPTTISHPVILLRTFSKIAIIIAHIHNTPPRIQIDMLFLKITSEYSIIAVSRFSRRE
jgi:hypothetical protein